MNLVLEVIDGLQKGQTQRVFGGLIVGRAAADFQLQDKKISSKHAVIEVDSSGKCYLIDQDSSNGILLNDQKIDRLLLKPGLKFKLGNTTLKVREMTFNELQELKKENWREFLHLEIPVLHGFDQPRDGVQTFPFSVSFQFKTGLQAGERYLLMFGPRSFGRKFCDFVLLDSSVSDELFEVNFDQGELVLTAKERDVVKLNSKPFLNGTLKNGDLLTFGDTTIEVEFL